MSKKDYKYNVKTSSNQYTKTQSLIKTHLRKKKNSVLNGGLHPPKSPRFPPKVRRLVGPRSAVHVRVLAGTMEVNGHFVIQFVFFIY